MKLLHVAGLCVLAALLSVASVWLVVERDVPSRVGAEQSQVEYVFFVNDSIGFDVARDKLRLGAVMPESRSRRNVSFSDPGASFVTASFSGRGSDWLSVQPRRAAFVNGSASLTVVVAPPFGAEFGVYRGNATFYVK